MGDQHEVGRLAAQDWQQLRQQRLLNVIGAVQVQTLGAIEEVASVAQVVEGLQLADQTLYLGRQFVGARRGGEATGGARTNSGSPNWWRSLFSLWLRASWLRAMRSAASEALRS